MLHLYFAKGPLDGALPASPKSASGSDPGLWTLGKRCERILKSVITVQIEQINPLALGKRWPRVCNAANTTAPVVWHVCDKLGLWHEAEETDSLRIYSSV